MGRRTTLMLVAILVAALGSTLVFLYVQGINDRAIADQEPVEVLTAKDDIAAGESIDDALAAGKLELTEVPKVNILPGALTTTEGLEGQLALTPIFSGEQIVSAKFGATANQSRTDDPQVGPGDLGRVQRPRPGRRLRPARLQGRHLRLRQAARTRPRSRRKSLAEYTCQGIRLLLADVEVIGVGTTTLLSTTTTDETGAQTTEEIPKTILTLALDPGRTQKRSSSPSATAT